MKKKKLASILTIFFGLIVVVISVMITLIYVSPDKEESNTQTSIEDSKAEDESLLIISPSESVPCSEEDILIISPVDSFTEKVTENISTTSKGSSAVAERRVVDLKLINKPRKLNYFLGDKINYQGLKVTATYSDGKTEDITKKLYVDNVNMNTAGEKIIKLYYVYNGHMYNKSVSFKISVATPSVKITEGVSSLRVGGTEQFKAYSNTKSNNIKWRSSNPTVLMCDSKGNVKALRAGTANITAILIYNNREYKSSSYKVSVISNAPQSSFTFSENPFNEITLYLSDPIGSYYISSLVGNVKSTYDIAYISVTATGNFMQDYNEIRYDSKKYYLLNRSSTRTKSFSFEDVDVEIEFLLDQTYSLELEVVDIKGYRKTYSRQILVRTEDVEGYYDYLNA